MTVAWRDAVQMTLPFEVFESPPLPPKALPCEAQRPYLPCFIGLSGYAQAGKDTVADFLVSDYGYVKTGFAVKLRQMACILNPELAVMVDELGWEYAKTQRGVRQFLQRLGTEAVRGVLGENTWVEAAFKGLDPTKRYVFTDTRFPNEADAIHQRSGVVLRVSRLNVGPVNQHASERALDGYRFDGAIANLGSLTDLRSQVDAFMGRYQ